MQTIRCSTRFNLMWSDPHVPGEKLIGDASGDYWCEQCELHRTLMEHGRMLGYPQMRVTDMGRAFDLKPTYEQWHKFTRTMGIHFVEAALKQARDSSNTSKSATVNYPSVRVPGPIRPFEEKEPVAAVTPEKPATDLWGDVLPFTPSKKPPAPNAFQPSEYQQAVFDYIQRGTSNLLIQAAAGSGKSTTLVQASLLLPSHAKAHFCAFNTHIKDELSAKLKALGSRMSCSTIHSMGRQALAHALPSGKARFDEFKYRDICKAYLQQKGCDFSSSSVTRFLKLIDFTRYTLSDSMPVALVGMVQHYELDIDTDGEDWDVMCRGVSQILAQGIELYTKMGIIDFTDMIYLPNVLHVACSQYDFLFIDECQDLNAAQLGIVMKSLKKDGRFVFVGDESQAIQGFAGADNNSMRTIIEKTNAHVLPLSICYRCPTSHVELASQICFDIEPSPFVDEGVIEIIPEHQFITTVQPGDLVLCRTTSPLVENCLKLLREGIRATVRGQDIGKNFIDLLRRLRKRKGFSIEKLPEIVKLYRAEQVIALKDMPDSEMKIATLNDNVATLRAIFDAYIEIKNGDATFTDFEAYIDSFFSDDKQEDPPVIFSTVHKAKGLEAPCVFILRPDLFPHPAAKQDWQKEQEYNIEYVVLTRAKWDKDKPDDSGLLFFVGSLPGNLRMPVRSVEEVA